MSRRYTGLPDSLKAAVLFRDQYRCRWCGRTDRRLDLHHIEYRKGASYDREDNLVALCRRHHELVHGTKHAGARFTLTKAEAQEILHELVTSPGVTGSALWRVKGKKVISDESAGYRLKRLD